MFRWKSINQSFRFKNISFHWNWIYYIIFKCDYFQHKKTIYTLWIWICVVHKIGKCLPLFADNTSKNRSLRTKDERVSHPPVFPNLGFKLPTPNFLPIHPPLVFYPIKSCSVALSRFSKSNTERGKYYWFCVIYSCTPLRWLVTLRACR